MRWTLCVVCLLAFGCAAEVQEPAERDEPDFSLPADKHTREGFVRTGEDLRALAPETTFITTGDHGTPQLGDDDLALLERFPRLQRLHLRHCRNISDDGLVHVACRTSLRELDLSGCVKITGNGIARLASLKSLRELLLNYCPKVRRNDVEALIPSLPRCDVVWSSDDPPMGGPPDYQPK